MAVLVSLVLIGVAFVTDAWKLYPWQVDKGIASTVLAHEDADDG
jgi:hypothetical protein